MNNKAERIWIEYSRLMLYIARGFFPGNSFPGILSREFFPNERTAEDAVSDAVIRILENLDRFDEIPSPAAKGLVIIITKNVCRDKMKKAGLPTTEPDGEEDPAPSPEALTISKETVRNIMLCLQKLPESYADILRLKFVSSPALAKGASNNAGTYPPSRGVSSPAPAKGASTAELRGLPLLFRFKSCPREGGIGRMARAVAGRTSVSSPAPAKGASCPPVPPASGD